MRVIRRPQRGPSAALLLVTGTTHFVAPRLLPRPDPAGAARDRDGWVYGSGRRRAGLRAGCWSCPGPGGVGGYAAAVLLVGVFPGNAWMAWQLAGPQPLEQLAAYGRLPLQVPLVVWALLRRPRRTS